MVKRIAVSIENLYLVLFGIYAALYILDRSLINIHIIYQLYMLCMLVILGAMTIFRLNITLKRLILIGVIGIVFLIAAYVTDRTNMLVWALLVINADAADFRKIVKVSLIAGFPALLFIFACSQVGLIPDYIFNHEGMKAHGMGFSYYSFGCYPLMFNMMSYLYLRKKDITLIEILVLLGMNYACYKFTTLRLTFFIFILISVMFILMVKFDLVKKVDTVLIRVLACLSWIVAFSITIWSALHYRQGSKFWREMDEIVNSRIYMSNKAFSMYNVKWIGQYIEMNGNAYGNHVSAENYFFIDSGYVYILLVDGILFTVLVLLMYTYVTHAAVRSNDKPLAIWAAALVLFTAINNPLVALTYNPFLLYFMHVHRSKRSNTDVFLDLIRSKVRLQL